MSRKDCRRNAVVGERPMSQPEVDHDKLDRLCQRIAELVESGQASPVDVLLAESPDLKSDTALLIDCIYAEFSALEGSGRQPLPEDYIRRFPKLAEQLQRLFEVHQAIGSGTSFTPDSPQERIEDHPQMADSHLDILSQRSGNQGRYKNLVATAAELPAVRSRVEATRTSRMHVVLTVIGGPHVGKTFTFDRHDHFFVGRATVAHFRLAESDPYFSRLHFMIEVNPPACRILDLKSTNGTFVNGTTIESTDLQHGDLIEAGDTVLRLTIGEDSMGNAAKTLQKSEREYDHGVDPADAHGREAEEQIITPKPTVTEFKPVGYSIESILGTGGMGIVYRAKRVTDGMTVAIKAIKPAVRAGSAETKRFLREIDILSQLQHPQIIRLLEVGEADGCIFFAMEFVDGVDLQSWCERRSQPISVSFAIKLMLPILKALQHAHERGFAHRDIKPRNILIASRENKIRIKLADFGLSRAFEQSKLSGLTLTGDLCGTPVFMAPEQIVDAKRVQPASDIYSSAATLYWIITRKYTHEFTPSIQKTLQQILLDDPVPIQNHRPDVPTEVAREIHRALSKDPGQRFQSIREFSGLLRSHIQEA